MDVKSNLKDVIERNFDAYKGYQKAADKVENARLADAFRKEAQQRRQFALELERNVNVLGHDALKDMEDGTFEGSLHRAWIDVKTAFSSDKDETVVEECIRGEEDAIEEYDELLKENNFTGMPHDLVARQRNEVSRTITELRQLESVLD